MYKRQGLLGWLLFQLLNKLGRVHAASHADEMLHGLTVQLPLVPLKLGDDLIDLVLDLLFILQHLETVQQLTKGSRWIRHQDVYKRQGIHRPPVFFIPTRRVKSISKLFCIGDLIRRGFI